MAYAGPDPVRVAGRSGCVESAEQRSVATDVPDRVDAWRAVLAAPVHDFGGERKLPAVVEVFAEARIGVREFERERIRRVNPCDRGRDFPGVGKIDQARFLDGAQKLASAPRVIVGKRRRKLNHAKCGKGAREYRAGGTVRAESWLGHGFSSSRVLRVGRDVEE